MKVPSLPKEKIAERASALISYFQSLAGYEIKPPIPVEEMIERALGLRLVYDDLEAKLGNRDILGAIYVEVKLICINERLFEHSSEGRLVFTCGHEAGHWVLHRKYAAPDSKGRAGRFRGVQCERCGEGHRMAGGLLCFLSAHAGKGNPSGLS